MTAGFVGNGQIKSIRVTEDRWVGPDQHVFIIAEIGYNFHTLEEGLASIDAAAECGVDAVKFQTFRAETTVVRSIDFPREAGGGNQFAEFKKYELSREWHQSLFARARKKGLTPFSTPSHVNDLSLLRELGSDLYKIGSDDLTNLPLQEAVARAGKPVVISTGMSYLSEVAATVELIRSTGNHDIVVLHCLSNYPIENVAELNLRAIHTMRESMGVLTGFSDHTTGFAAAGAATTLGACVYERHFTLDKKIPAPDAWLSADPSEMKRIVAMIRETESMLGDGRKRPAESELRMRRDTRKSVVSVKSIRKGERIGPEHVDVKRPGHGIEPAALCRVMGRTAVRDIGEDVVLQWDMLM